jgi:hypothetical protein
MAVAFDAVGGGATKTSSPWTITWSHTAAGGANCVVLISFAATPTLTNTSSTKAGWHGRFERRYLHLCIVESADRRANRFGQPAQCDCAASR